MSVQFHPLRVRKIEPDTQEAVVVSFEVPPELREVFGFTQGQYLTLRADIDGQDLRRSYSICAGVDDGELRVGVRKVRGGVFSNWINEHLKPGDEVKVMAPQGRFFVPIEPGASRHHVGMAGGSGITPILSIMKTVLAREPHSRFTLIYGNRSSHSMMFRQALADLKDRYPQRLQVIHLFSQESMDSDLLQGRIDGDKLRQLADHLLDFSRFDEAFICGPAVMMDEAETTLRELGVAEKSIHLERFNTPGGNVKRAAGVQAEGRTVTIRQDGRDRLIALSAEDDSILDAALRQGADLPFACKGGVCATCKCKVLRGEVAMAANYSLEADELAAGYVLSCQSLPTSGDVVVDFDARGMA